VGDAVINNMKRILIFLLSAVAVVGAIRPLAVLEVATDLTARLPGQRDTVYLLGVSSINDGNGGLFYWDPTSTDTPDGVDTFQLDAGGVGRYKRVNTPGGGSGGGGGSSSTITLDDLYLRNPDTGNYIHFYITGSDGDPTFTLASGGSGGTTNNYLAIWLTNTTTGTWTKFYVNGGTDTDPDVRFADGGSGGTNNFTSFKLRNQTTTTAITISASGSATDPTITLQ